MTDNEVIKALECCSNNVLYEQCVDCPHEEYLEKGHTCIIRATKDALDLINQLKAENSELLRKNTELQQEIRSCRAEAIKEFAELVKLEFYREFDELIPSIMADKIDSLAEEITVNYESSKQRKEDEGK